MVFFRKYRSLELDLLLHVDKVRNHIHFFKHFCRGSAPTTHCPNLALALTWTAEPIGAEKALEMGLVSQLHEDPLAAAMDYCRQIKERSPDACGGVKKLYHKAWHHNDRKMLALEWIYQSKIMMGKNLWIAIKRQRGKDIPYKPRGSW